MPLHKSLYDWFQYSDRNKFPFNPITDTTITVEKFLERDENKVSSKHWQREECFICSALVPIKKLEEAASIIRSSHDLIFGFGWNGDGQFSFGNETSYGNIQFFPLALFRKHPITNKFKVELSHDFITYHALLERSQNQYYHPTDDILVAETGIDLHDFYDPSASVVVHRNYLRDFLAVKKMGLLISVTAYRFANASTEEELQLTPFNERQIDEFSWLSVDIQTPKFTQYGYFQGRSILRQNFIVEPYEKPLFDRNPWFYFGKKATKNAEFPSFIVNSEGKRKKLPQNTYLGNYVEQGIGKMGYLYFRPEVLQKYLTDPKYSVFFHMRNWGAASLPGDKGTIDVGINSHGLVNAFAPDIVELSSQEQAYWASFSSLPSGEVCEEMFQTRMQLMPPHSPGTVEMIRNTRSRLNSVFEQNFSSVLYKDEEPSKQDLYRLSIGPIGNQFEEVLDLAKISYGWIIETMQIETLRTAIISLEGEWDKQLRQIKLLEKILIAKKISKNDARSITAPLVGLNELRIGSAHFGKSKLESSFHLLGASKMPETPREGWFLCLDAVIKSLNLISDSFH